MLSKEIQPSENIVIGIPFSIDNDTHLELGRMAVVQKPQIKQPVQPPVLPQLPRRGK